MSEELLIENGLVVPMDGKNRVLKNTSVVVSGDKIAAIGDPKELSRKFPKARRLDASTQAVLPGIVNVHTHVSPTVMLRGLTEDRTDGFYGLAMPMEKHITPEDVYLTSRLCCAEMIELGSTCISEIWHYMEQTAKAVEETGLRGVLAHKVKEVDLAKIQFDEYEYDKAEGKERLETNIELIKKWHGKAGGRITCRIGTHAADTLTPELFQECKSVSQNLNVGIHIHVAQSKEEVQHMQKTYGKGSVEFLHDIDFLDENVLAAHLVYISDREIDILAETGTYMAHCPAIMAKRARFSPMGKIYARGVNVALGNDWVNMDPWDNMRMAIAGARLTTLSVMTIDAYRALEMATIKAAKALHLDKEIGSLEVGKKADIILLDLDVPHLSPLNEHYDPIATLVYNASGRDTNSVLIDGKFVMQDRKIETVDVQAALREAEAATLKLWNRVKKI
jgi:5-methylthioadenosine/S-adenosylhomocysteine deaminase